MNDQHRIRPPYSPRHPPLPCPAASVCGPEAHQVSGIGGSQEAVPVAIGNWHADKVRLPNTTIDSGDFSSERRASGYVGLLGSDILTQFGLVSIDYANGTLTVYKQIA